MGTIASADRIDAILLLRRNLDETVVHFILHQGHQVLERRARLLIHREAMDLIVLGLPGPGRLPEKTVLALLLSLYFVQTILSLRETGFDYRCVELPDRTSKFCLLDGIKSYQVDSPERAIGGLLLGSRTRRKDQAEQGQR